MFDRRVYLYVEELLHDIDAELLKLSKLMALEGEMNQELQTDETKNNRPLMLRRIESHVGNLVQTMQAYVVDVCKCSSSKRRSSMYGDAGDDASRHFEEYEFELSFPENWRKNAFVTLSGEMHSYVVNGCVADFLKSSYPRQAESYMSVAERSMWNVKHCVTSRVPESVRKPSGWF